MQYLTQNKIHLLITGILLCSMALIANTDFTANVMAPLKVTDMSEFESWCTIAKSIGVDAVSVDVWWGDVEISDNVFTWNYYDNLFAKIKAKGLKIVPIMSFHQCGGGVGDNYTSKLPVWVWSKGTDLRYKSEQGNFSDEYVALWADDVVKHDYLEFMNEFESHFVNYSSDFLEINISCGPSGELRYPSYNMHDAGTGYPTRGAFQGYSERAKSDFREWVQAKYGSIAAVQSAWNCNPPLTGWSQVSVPTQPTGYQMTEFWDTYSENTVYGKDLFAWYNSALVKHGKRMLTYAVQAFNESMANVPLGYKISGIHWRVSDQYHPRAAELNGGLIPKYVIYNDDDGYGYNEILSIPKVFSRKIIIHYTCLEMDDKEYENGKYVASKAKSLVFWIGNEAFKQDIAIKGENALAGGVYDDHGWYNIDDATTFSSYRGLTVLRINDVIGGIGKEKYQHYISKFKNASLPSLYIRGTFNNWSTHGMHQLNCGIWIDTVAFANSSSERFKFDVYGDWSKNYGGTGSEGTAIPGGNDIGVQPNKKYIISFNDKTLYYKTNMRCSNSETVIHYQEFEPANTYSLHCWDGLYGDFAMTYEGKFNGSHWWKIKITNPSSSFKFCFFNGNNNWDGGNRVYLCQATTIYINKYDNSIYMTRP